MKYLVSGLLLAIVIVSSAWYAREMTVCPVPLTYRLGTIAPEFDLTEEDALAYVTAAEGVWESATGRELFEYDEASQFTIDFVFDERQELANSEKTNRAELDAAQQANESLRITITELQEEYDAVAAAFSTRRNDYEADLASYNAEVRRYNDRGGAPSDVHAELERERVDLNSTARELSRTAATLDSMAEQLNELSVEGNRRIEDYNDAVKAYNNEYGFTREFTQGDYQGDSISIYKFSSVPELERVLAHEFGHALGIGHVESESSVMYYLLEEPATTPLLDSADEAAFREQCGSGNELRYKVRAATDYLKNLLFTI